MAQFFVMHIKIPYAWGTNLAESVRLLIELVHNNLGISASKNTDPSVFYTETKILNTDSAPLNTPIIRVIAVQQITVTLWWKSEKSNANL